MKGSDLYKLLQQQGFKCALTGESLTPQTAGLDHAHPASDGGKSDMGNLQWVLRDINRMKGVMTNDEFIAICRRVVAWANRSQ